ncbi:MAG: hypothetical protein ACLQVY_18160 [Limisphaerales bacterium]
MTKCIIAGQMLTEKRQQLTSCHDGRKISIDDRGADQRGNSGVCPDPVFEDWLKSVCPFISERTAYRWMKAARRVMFILLELHGGKVAAIDLEGKPINPITIDLEGNPIKIYLEGNRFFLSDILSRPEADCSDAMLKIREALDTFLADKTLSEATASVIDGEDEAHRITRAANGKLKGGKPHNRLDYARFVATHFEAMSGIFQKWDEFITEQPEEHAKMAEAMRVTIMGGAIRFLKKGRPKDLKPMPVSVAKLLAGILRTRLSDK